MLNREFNELFQMANIGQAENAIIEENAKRIASDMVFGRDLETMTYTNFDNLILTPGVIDQVSFMLVEYLDQCDSKEELSGRTNKTK